MGIDASNIWQLTDALSGKPEDKTNTRLATVSRIDDEGHVWVSIPGGETETPTETTDVEVERGDTVTVEWRNNKLYVLGNSTQPATSTKRVVQIVEPIEETANEAAAGVGKAVDASKAAQQAAQEAAAVAEAVNQHFWHRDTDPGDTAGAGAFVTDLPQEDFLEAIEQGVEPTEQQPLHNLLMNSEGILLRTAKKWFASFTHSTVTFFDGLGNGVNNIVAQFGANLARIGKASGNHVDITSSGMDVLNGNTSYAQFGTNGYLLGASGGSQVLGDSRSLQMRDMDNPQNTFFEVKDLRDANGVATVADSFVAEDGQRQFWQSLPREEIKLVTVNGVSTTAYTVTNDYVLLNTAPQKGATVVTTYTTKSKLAKAYTAGIRAANSFVGGMSLAEGNETVASGKCSHAEGTGSQATNQEAHAEGYYSKAFGWAAHAEGQASRASGPVSHAEGSSVAEGRCAHSEGDGTLAGGSYSHAQNFQTIANNRCQTVIGEKNVAETGIPATNRGNYALIIGNGDVVRSNALTVKWDGSVAHGSSNEDISETAISALFPSSTKRYIRIIDGDANGAALLMQAGGLTIVGGGEAANNLYTALGLAATNESLHLGADGTVYIHSNCNTVANRKTWTFNTDGSLTLPSGSKLGTLATKNSLSITTAGVNGTGKNSSQIAANGTATIQVTLTAPANSVLQGIMRLSCSTWSLVNCGWLCSNYNAVAGTVTVDTYWRNVTGTAVAANSATVTVTGTFMQKQSIS